MRTISEDAVPGFDAGVWYGAYVPAKTPRAVVDQLNAELVAILKLPEFVAWLRDQGLQPVVDTPEQARERLRLDVERWAGVAKAAGIMPQ